jgi:hypothetical protein
VLASGREGDSKDTRARNERGREGWNGEASRRGEGGSLSPLSSSLLPPGGRREEGGGEARARGGRGGRQTAGNWLCGARPADGQGPHMWNAEGRTQYSTGGTSRLYNLVGVAGQPSPLWWSGRRLSARCNASGIWLHSISRPGRPGGDYQESQRSERAGELDYILTGKSREILSSSSQIPDG